MNTERSIYVVDDDQVARRQVVGLLVEVGYHVEQGADGNQALAMVRRQAPDLMLLDVEMPGMSGPQVCRLLKGSPSLPFFPIILVTARDDLRTKVGALELGADDYLVKPVNQAELLARVKSMLRLKQLQDELLKANEALEKSNKRLQELSITDPLMGIFNRLYFEKRFRYEFQRAKRYRSSLAVLMFDIDHFKRINDEHGHQFGDLVLKKCATLMRNTVREVDILARYGGEEIVLVLPETNLEQGKVVAERIRRHIEEHPFQAAEKRVPVTVSVGLAVYHGQVEETQEELLRRADDALYRAKAEGRNCLRF